MSYNKTLLVLAAEEAAITGPIGRRRLPAAAASSGRPAPHAIPPPVTTQTVAAGVSLPLGHL